MAKDSAPERLSDLVTLLQATEGFAAVAQAMRAGRGASVDGAWASSAALAVAALADKAPSVILVTLAHPADLDTWAADLAGFTGQQPQIFPAFDTWSASRSPLDSAAAARLQIIQRLHGKLIVLASIQALVQPVPTPAALAARRRLIRTGEAINVEELTLWLVERGYRRVDAVEAPGDFSRRGGIFDIFSPDAEAPYRLELFGDEVESMRAFAADTQRSLGAITEAGILAVSLAGRTSDRDQDFQSGPRFGVPSLARLANDGSDARTVDTGHLVDHLPPDAWTILVEPNELREQAERYRERVDSVGLYSPEGCLKQLVGRPSATVTTLPHMSTERTWSLRVESVERFSGKVEKIREELDSIAATERVMIACPSEAEAKRLTELLAESRLVQEKRIAFPRGHVHAGFRLVEPHLVVLGAHQLFARDDLVAEQRLGPKRRIESRAIDTFLDLAEGDLVVHVAHGIARFRGMMMLDQRSEIRDQRSQISAEQSTALEEHLILEFRDGVRVYVPASKIDLVQKYVGGAKTAPELSKFGGTAWNHRKERVQEAVRDLAADMLQMQAVRAAQPGFGYPPDSEWQRQFEASFPYQETPDQLASLKEIKADLERGRPMDRLICGDVGYGKTELALRAAFKAVDNGRQVAVLVPTTVLAEQHFRTFTARFSGYPFTIACLNRFRPASEQRRIVKHLAEGGVDVVIGTHRVTSADVKFKDLGLVIIDEEQRFGVEHKERLKRLRVTVDVLTMTATPIPRTLHLSLLGIRDISNLETAPADRMPIETRITRFDKELIRSAINRELNREGQVYFVHNRVMDIHAVASKVQSMVPEASIAIAHGQQSADELEDAMVAFVQKEADVLVATTIVESGLDIPNANTIFIDEADRYGLADLHQLRGRVGRHNVRAYAYLLVSADRTVTPEAARRLKAIEEFTELGAGFKIALRDLEIRGAGNILGMQQSGHIAAVGYEMYCQLLENAVRHLKKLPPKAQVDVSIDVPWPAYLPRDYVPGQKQRLEVYRRLARVRDPQKLGDFRQELRDRYGPLPEPAEWLLRLVEIRLLAAKWHIASLHRDGPDIVLTYRSEKHVRRLVDRIGKRLRIVDAKQAYYRLAEGEDEPERMYQAMKRLLATERNVPAEA
ncbi:MAG: transcription-repair coupling factor [Gemmataceae bacterium]